MPGVKRARRAQPQVAPAIEVERCKRVRKVGLPLDQAFSPRTDRERVPLGLRSLRSLHPRHHSNALSALRPQRRSRLSVQGGSWVGRIVARFRAKPGVGLAGSTGRPTVKPPGCLLSSRERIRVRGKGACIAPGSQLAQRFPQCAFSCGYIIYGTALTPKPSVFGCSSGAGSTDLDHQGRGVVAAILGDGGGDQILGGIARLLGWLGRP